MWKEDLLTQLLSQGPLPVSSTSAYLLSQDEMLQLHSKAFCIPFGCRQPIHYMHAFPGMCDTWDTLGVADMELPFEDWYDHTLGEPALMDNGFIFTYPIGAQPHHRWNGSATNEIPGGNKSGSLETENMPASRKGESRLCQENAVAAASHDLLCLHPSQEPCTYTRTATDQQSGFCTVNSGGISASYLQIPPNKILVCSIVRAFKEIASLLHVVFAAAIYRPSESIFLSSARPRWPECLSFLN